MDNPGQIYKENIDKINSENVKFKAQEMKISNENGYQYEENINVEFKNNNVDTSEIESLSSGSEGFSTTSSESDTLSVSSDNTGSTSNNMCENKIKYVSTSILDINEDTIAINLTYSGENKILGISQPENLHINSEKYFGEHTLTKVNGITILSVFERNHPLKSFSNTKLKEIFQIIKTILSQRNINKISINQANLMKYPIEKIFKIIKKVFEEEFWDINIHVNSENTDMLFNYKTIANVLGLTKVTIPYAECMVNKIKSHCMMDSGAQCSVVSYKLVDDLNLLQDIIKSDDELTGVSGEVLDTLGKIKLNIIFKDKILSGEFRVSGRDTNLPSPILLGGDFLRSHDAILNYKDSKTIFQDITVDWINSDSEYLMECENISIVVKENLSLKPYSRSCIEYKINNINKSKYFYINEVNKDFHDKKLKVCFSEFPHLQCVDDNMITLQIDNKQNKSKELKQNDIICNITLVKAVPCLKINCLNISDSNFNKGSQDNNEILGEKELIDENKLTIEDKLKNVIDDIDEKEDLENFHRILLENKKAFAVDENDLGCLNDFCPRIELTDDTPVVCKPYRTPHSKGIILDEEVKRLLKCGIIKESRSSYASPCLIVNKPNGKPRLCIDFRKLNKRVKQIHYPLPHLETALQLLSGKKYYTALDLVMAYHQVPLDPRDTHITAFTTSNGLYHYERLPYGLVVSGSLLQESIERVLIGLNRKVCLVYVDDIIIYGKDVAEHDQNLKLVLNRLQEHGFKINPEKCKFRKTNIECLGHVISEKGIEPHPNRIQALKNKKVPRNVKDVRSFVGLCSYYRRFVKDFAIIAKPLTNLTKKNVRFKWDETCQNAYETLIERITSAPILTPPTFDRPFYLTTDASIEGIGCVLSQVHDDIHKPIAFYSRALNNAEKKYPIYQLEGLAMKVALQKFRYYIYGYEIIIRSDNKPVIQIFKNNQCEGPLSKYLAIILEYSPKFQYIPGKENFCADFLSRNVNAIKVKTLEEKLSNESIKKAQQKDKEIKELQTKGDVIIENGLIYNKGNANQLIVPNELKQDFLKYFHNTIGCHEGIARTKARLKKHTYWKNMDKDIRNYVNGCEVCKLAKPSHLPKQFIGEFPHPKRIFERLHIDIIGPFKTTKNKNKYILAAIDAFTHWCILEPISNKTTKNVISVVEKSIIGQFLKPEIIVCDQGTEFSSYDFKNFCHEQNIQLHLCAAYHHASNGMVERLNLQVGNALRCLMIENKGSWDEHIEDIMMSLNTTKHSSIGTTPYELLKCKERKIDLQCFKEPEKFDYYKYIQLNKNARKTLKSSKKAMFDKNNKYRRDRLLKVGDKVYVKVNKVPHKLSPLYKGPMTITKVHETKFSYDVIDQQGVTYQTHINNIK